jgi:nitrogen-specific signal transduction histidine kinase
MVASVVADHGGMVEVDSARGGTVFRINFPLGEGPAHNVTGLRGGEPRR